MINFVKFIAVPSHTKHWYLYHRIPVSIVISIFFQDKTVLCPSHTYSAGGQGGTPPHNDPLKTLAVYRKVYVQRKETKQIASIMQQGELMQGEKLLTWLAVKRCWYWKREVASLIFIAVMIFFTRHFLCFVALADNWTALCQRY